MLKSMSGIWPRVIILGVLMINVMQAQEPSLEELQKEFPELVRPAGLDDFKWLFVLRRHKWGMQKNVPIKFYGKIVDQNNVPVEGVEVQAACSSYRKEYDQELAQAISEKKSERDIREQNKAVIEIQTDVNGCFSIADQVGFSLDCVFKKPGYLPPRERSYYSYLSEKKRTYSDPQKPVVVQMWKKSGGPLTILVRRELRLKIEADETPCFIDVVQGKKVKDGGPYDLMVKGKIVNPEEKHPDWIFILEVSGGGIVDIDPSDKFMFSPPEAGYQNQFVYDTTKDPSGKIKGIEKKCYLKSREGKIYGTLIMRIKSTGDKNLILAIESTVNPNGERNLESEVY